MALASDEPPPLQALALDKATSDKKETAAQCVLDSVKRLSDD